MRAGGESIDGHFFEEGKSTRLFWPVLGLVVAAIAMTSKQQDPGVLGVGILLAVVSVYPFYFWLINWSHGLPIWPVFSAVTGLTAALPMFQDTSNLEGYSAFEISTGGMTMVGFLLLGTVVWLSLAFRLAMPPKKVLTMSRQHATSYLFVFLSGGVLFQMNNLAGLFWLPGNLMQVLRGVSMSLAYAAIFILAFLTGRGMLGVALRRVFAILTVLFVLFAISGLLLAQAIIPVALAIFGLMLGSGRFAWKFTLAGLAVLAVLHAGKFQMRSHHWEDGIQGFMRNVTLVTLPKFYLDWFDFGVRKLTGVRLGDAESVDIGEASSLFARAGTLHMLLLVQQKSPKRVPFLLGATYEPIPRLLIPRFLDDKKGSSHAGNVLLTVNYGLQTLEQTQFTSVGWGLVPEAYANFGYAGVGMLAVLLGAFYAWVGNFSVGVPILSLRFVLALLILGGALRTDTMGVFVTSQFQGLVGASLAALVLMKRQRNPFAASAANGGLLAYGTTGRKDGASVGRGLRGERPEARGREWEGENVGRWEDGGERRKDEEPEVGGVELEAMKAGLKRIYGKHYPLPKWAAFRHRMILMEIAKLERQLEKGVGEVKK